MSDKVKARVSEARRAVVDVIVEMMERDGLRWVCGWDGSAFAPVNGATNRQYRGCNRFHLMAAAYVKGYDDPRWFTFNQARGLGYHPAKGEHGALVEYWRMFSGMKDADGNWTDDADACVSRVSFPKLVRYHAVFNAAQLADGGGQPMPPAELPAAVAGGGDAFEVADRLIATSRCAVRESKAIAQAAYSPLSDTVKMPSRLAFTSMEAFVTTLAHEMAHSTMKPLGREEAARGAFGSEAYAFEELVAELGSTFCCIDLGIHRIAEVEGDENFGNHAAYLKSWLKALREDPDYLFQAASKADEAAGYIAARYNGEGAGPEEKAA